MKANSYRELKLYKFLKKKGIGGNLKKKRLKPTKEKIKNTDLSSLKSFQIYKNGLQVIQVLQ
jgi:hypothetical protein